MNKPEVSESFLTPSERECLAVVLDLIIPASSDGRLPSAAQYDVWANILAFRPDLASTIREELARVDRRIRESTGQPLSALARDQAAALIDELRTAEPTLLNSLAKQTITFYYQQDQVLEAIGLPSRPPFPIGFEVRSGDLTLLDAVRARGKRYRDI